MTQPAKHTPGPWQISAIQNEPEKISIIDADMCFVAEVWQTYINGESRQQANAHLIAAAPAMYEALSSILKDIEKVEPRTLSGYANLCAMFRTVAKSALAQAEGKQ